MELEKIVSVTDIVLESKSLFHHVTANFDPTFVDIVKKGSFRLSERTKLRKYNLELEIIRVQQLMQKFLQQ